MELSPFQSKILSAVDKRVSARSKKGLLVEARAGAGKSTMIWLICQQLQAQGFSPREVTALVFGRKNKDDLQKKIEQKVGQNWGAVVRTLHSLCYGIYRDALNVKHQRVNSDNSKYTRIAQEYGFFPLKDESRGIDTPGGLLEGEKPAIYSEKDFTDLLDRLRLYCLDATPENVDYLVNLYKLGVRDIGLVAAAAEFCLAEGLKVATNLRYWIDMTDMVYTPWAMRMDSRFSSAITSRREQLRFLLLDEAQDTDLLQIEMLSLLVNPARSFLTAVGDRNQAVYFFRGALNDGMDRIKERFQGEDFPLPVCYRCGSKHLDLVREVFPSIAIQPRPGAPAGEIRVVHSRDFHRIFDSEHLSYMGVCRKNAPLVKAAIQLLAAGKPAKIKDRNIGGRLVARVKDICQKQRVKYDPDTFIRVSLNYEEAQRRRLQDFPNSENQILDLTDMLEAIRALFQAYEPDTFKAWERIVERIFDESGYSPISLYTIHSGKGGEGQVSFIIYPEDLPFSHPKQVPEEKEQEDHLLYVALTRTLADGAEGSGILYLVCREADERDEDDLAPSQRGKVKWPSWLPLKYRQLWNWGKPNQPESVYVEPALSEPATVSEVGLVEPEQDESDLNYWSDSMLATEPTETAAPPPTAPTVDEISSLNEAEKQELSTLEKQISQALAIPKRLWYEGGKALVRVRDNRLYRESHSDFHKYCLERFNKTRRHIDRWITAAAARDNLASSGCKVLPEAESVLRPIASLPPSQQVEVWNRAVEAVVGCPTAAKVEEIRDMFLGKTLPQPIEDEQAELDPSVQTNWSKSSALESQSLAQARDWILRMDLTEMESLHLWLGELIQSLSLGED